MPNPTSEVHTVQAAKCAYFTWIVLMSLSCHYSAMECDSLQWRHNERDGVSNHQLIDYLLPRLFRRISKRTSKLCVTCLCGGIHRWPINCPYKGRVKRKIFPLMTSYYVAVSPWLLLKFQLSNRSTHGLNWQAHHRRNYNKAWTMYNNMRMYSKASSYQGYIL